jgi:hypothetical protein
VYIFLRIACIFSKGTEQKNIIKSKNEEGYKTKGTNLNNPFVFSSHKVFREEIDQISRINSRTIKRGK